MKRREHKIKDVRPAGPNHQVVQLTGQGGDYQRKPCGECPWRLDSPVGAFPAEAYRISAKTAYDASLEMFSCHVSGTRKVKTCAGFLLANSQNNVGVRLMQMRDALDMDAVSSDVALYRSYRDMAIANGVDPDDPVLQDCRSDHD